MKARIYCVNPVFYDSECTVFVRQMQIYAFPTMPLHEHDANNWNLLSRWKRVSAQDYHHDRKWPECCEQLNHMGSLNKHELTLIQKRISNRMPGKVWDKITYPFPNFNGCTKLGMGM